MTINKNFLVKNGLEVGGNTQITGSLTAAGLVYPVSDGDERNAIITDGLGNLSFEPLEDVRSSTTNQTGSLIPKGSPVYQTGTAGQTVTIGLADASDPATMPAIGITASDIADGDTGWVLHSGRIQGIDTSAFAEGDVVYVGVGGGYTNVIPTGEGNLIQNLGFVTKVHATNGSGVILGAGRANAVPNLNDGNIFIGSNLNQAETALLDTDLVPENTNLYFTTQRAIDAIEGSTNLTIDGGTFYIDTSNNYIGINDTSPQQALDVTGAIAIGGTTVVDSGGEVVTAQLKDSGVTAASYGSSSQVPVITIDSKGRITSASTTAVAGVTSFSYTPSSNVLNISTADGGSFNADISSIGGSIQGTIANTKVQYGVNYNGTPQQGSFFFDSLNQKLKVYTGTQFVDAVPAGTGGGGGGDTSDAVATFEKYTYTLPSQTNAISGTDDNSNQLAYVVDGSQNVEVYVNGVKAVEGTSNDYVATTGTSVTFTYNLPAGSVVEVQVYELLTQDAFYLKADTYTKTETNTQISTAVADYLPLAGGTMTGVIAGFESTGIDDNATDTVVTVQQNGNVGIGIDGPGARLTLGGTAGAADNSSVMLISLGATQKTYFGTANATGNIITGSSSGDTVLRSNGHNILLSVDSGASEAMRIDSSGKVGIGTNSPSSKLHLNGTGATDAKIELQSGTGVASLDGRYGNVILSSDEDDVVAGSLMAFRVDNSEAMRIDSGGNLLVGKQSNGLANDGLEMSSTGYIGASISNDVAAYFNRRGNAGDVVSIMDDQVQVGALSTGSGGYMAIRGGNNTFGSGLLFGNVSIKPTSASGVVSDGAVDLGDSGARFKDLFLSGGLRGDTTFKNNAGTTEYARFNSSGSLLVGATSDVGLGNGTNEGISISSSQKQIIVGTDSDVSLYLNRQSSDGTIAEFRKNGSAVGSIATQAWGFNFGGSGNDSNGISCTGGNGLIPLRNMQLSTNTQDIGSTTYKWKDGHFSGTLNAANFNTTSDAALKTNVETLNGSLDAVKSLRGVSFDWLENGGSEIGVIAQEVEAVLPDVVSTNDEGIKSVKYGNMVAVLIEAIKEQQAQIDELKAQLNS